MQPLELLNSFVMRDDFFEPRVRVNWDDFG